MVPPGLKRLVLRSYEGITYRLVSTAPPRNCTDAEISIIDVAGMYEDLDARRKVANDLLGAAETMGFFYIENHQKAKEVFNLPLEQKRKLSSTVSSYGYHGIRATHVNPSESKGMQTANPPGELFSEY
jgi:isopenicillin N synthase-like dioxygenase